MPIIKNKNPQTCMTSKGKYTNMEGKFCTGSSKRNNSEKKYKANQQSKLKTVNSYTLIKQNYKKHNQEFYQALDKVSNFYSECTSENDICNNLLKYFQDRCSRKERQRSKKVSDGLNCGVYSNKKCYDKKKDSRDNDVKDRKIIPNEEDDESLSDNACALDENENRYYKDQKLFNLMNEYKKLNQEDENFKMTNNCKCKNIKLCDVICHKCQRKIVKMGYNTSISD